MRVSAPAAPPSISGWEPIAPLEVVDQGIRVAFLSALIDEPHVSAFFIAVALPAGLADWRITSVDLRVEDQSGGSLVSRTIPLDGTNGVTVDGVVVGALRPGTSALSFGATEVRATRGADVRTFHGRWRFVPLKRYGSGAQRPNEIFGAAGELCFYANGVAVGAMDEFWCPSSPPPTSEPKPGAVERPPPHGPPALPVEPERPIQAKSSSPVATGPLPSPTPTPTHLNNRAFTNWSKGIFGTGLTLSQPTPHRIFILVKEDGTLERVSPAEFEAARR